MSEPVSFTPVRGDFLGWVVSLNSEAHALYLNDNGPVYWCGGVLYSLGVTIPTVYTMTTSFCPTCRMVVSETESPDA